MSFGFLSRIFCVVIEVERGSILGIVVVGKDIGFMAFWLRGYVWYFMCK